MVKGGFPSAKVLLSVQTTNAPCSRSIMLLKQTLQEAHLKGPISAQSASNIPNDNGVVH